MTGAVSVGSGTYGGWVTGGGNFAALTTRFNRAGLGLPCNALDLERDGRRGSHQKRAWLAGYKRRARCTDESGKRNER